MPISNAMPLVILALLLGYMACLYNAKRYLKKEVERLAGKIFKTLQDEEKAQMQ